MTVEKLVAHAGVKLTVATAVVATDVAILEPLCTRWPTTCTVISSVHHGLWILWAMMALDLLSGVMAARVAKTPITSRRFGEGIQRKVGMLLVVAGSFLLEEVFRQNSLDFHGLLVKWTVTWFIATEGLSLYENAVKLGIPMPSQFKRALDWLLSR